MGLLSKSSSNNNKVKIAGGADKLYFILHNTFSLLLFMSYLWISDLRADPHDRFLPFLIYYGKLLGLTFVFGLITRLFVYFPLKLHYEDKGRAIPSLVDINSHGINEFLTYPYFVRTTLSMLAFALFGELFPNEPQEYTLIAYFLIKAAIYGYVYIKYK